MQGVTEPVLQLSDPDPAVRSAARKALVQRGKAAVPVLIRALRSESELARESAATALGEIGPDAKEAVPALIQGLKDASFWVRGSAAMALGKIGAKEAVPALIQALKEKDESDWVRDAAATALRDLGPDAKEAVPALIEALKDKSYWVRGSAAMALGKVGPDAEKAAPALTWALRDENDRVRKSAAMALKKLGIPAAGNGHTATANGGPESYRFPIPSAFVLLPRELLGPDSAVLKDVFERLARVLTGQGYSYNVFKIRNGFAVATFPLPIREDGSILPGPRSMSQSFVLALFLKVKNYLNQLLRGVIGDFRFFVFVVSPTPPALESGDQPPLSEEDIAAMTSSGNPFLPPEVGSLRLRGKNGYALIYCYTKTETGLALKRPLPAHVHLKPILDALGRE